MDLSILKVWNSNLKWTEVQIKPELYSKINERHFEDLEPLLRQTSYLKAHDFPDANKRWRRIKVGGSRLFRCLLIEF
ncbi:hypothetical protein RclHR1_03770004 [Rhizophagus clarus]|uniref:Uncharacterized protein n=1 Tax=Rhizophagus clarus TaxID=94130 RepID=A0A2Z6S783_9GLOM|nr:hypothetical protein RclHR1_03770004 [Rhizophagus clarus]